MYSAFPPFGLIMPLLSFLRQQGNKRCTLLVPSFDVKPVWWPLLILFMVDHFVFGQKNEMKVILIPTKKGFQYSKFGLTEELLKCLSCFLCRAPPSWECMVLIFKAWNTAMYVDLLITKITGFVSFVVLKG